MQLLSISFAFFLTEIFTVNCQYTHLDTKFGPFVKVVRLFMSDLIKPKSFEVGYQISLKNGKAQQLFKDEFFCDAANGPGRRSKSVPTSVHRLTPGDIDIIGALGDSLTAANGAFALESAQTLIEGRGVSWSIGGRDNWRKFLTLPNLIKVYNPKLYGYSEATHSLGFQRESKFNAAEPTAISFHTIQQAKNLVKRMRSDPHVDINKHWKVITIMIGSNDFCLDICYYDNQDKLIDDAEKYMIHVLRIIRDNLPRTLVNVVIPVDVGLLFTFKKVSAECKGFHYTECPCLISLSHFSKIKKTLRTVRLWKERIEKVVDMEEFHDREDFEVTLIKFTKNARLPETENDSTDFTYLSHDCFHLSQKGHSYFAMNLWNQMLTKESERPKAANFITYDVKCPTNENPYFRTRKN